MNKELQTIATTYEVFEAEFLRNHLEAEGFEVYLADENIIGVFNLLAPAIGGIKIPRSRIGSRRRADFRRKTSQRGNHL